MQSGKDLVCVKSSGASFKFQCHRNIRFSTYKDITFVTFFYPGPKFFETYFRILIYMLPVSFFADIAMVIGAVLAGYVSCLLQHGFGVIFQKVVCHTPLRLTKCSKCFSSTRIIMFPWSVFSHQLRRLFLIHSCHLVTRYLEPDRQIPMLF